MTARPASNLTPRANEIVTAARKLVEAEGVEALSMRRLAQILGIRAPSIYKHLPDKQALENAVISTTFEEQAVAFAGAVAESEDPVAAFAAAYREYARNHPHLYRLMTERPLDRDGLAPGAEEHAAAPIVAALGGDRDLARAVWAFAHGMTILELNSRFPADADLDAAWQRGLDAFRAQ